MVSTMGPLRGPGSKGSEGSACLWQAGSKGCGIALMGDEYKVRVTGFPAPQVILSLRNGTPLYGYDLCRAKEQINRPTDAEDRLYGFPVVTAVISIAAAARHP